MKIYILPTEKICNGKCVFCITRYRQSANKQFLDYKKIKSVLKNFKDIDNIEITGGGEPLLNPQI
jgi:molybdenum cofactor biosynthesis enzyme MoaA